ncbi:MAG: TonB-dependent receptor, partial [Melioribacter sp.]|nr:TonB-dependent receptor [Melioribacter sp.]
IVDDESLYNILTVFAKDYALTFNRINDQIVVKKSYGQTENLVTAIETGTIKGRVIDAKTKEAIVAASVLIKGTSRGALTNMSGYYTIDNVNAGQYTLVVSSVGFKAKEASVTVVANSTETLNFQLEATDINMNEIVVTTGTVLPTVVKKLPNTISVITAREIDNINPTDVADLVRLTVPGAIYTDEGVGTTYGAFSVRGVSTVSGAASTLKVYIDGVEASDPAYITYMDPSVIERVEVVPGPQASTIYGAGAISGVMQIFTKHGKPGNTKLSGKVSMTTIDNKYLPNNTPLGQEYLLNASGGYNFFGYNVGVNYQTEPQWVELFQEQALNLTGSTNFNFGDLTGGFSLNYSKRNTTRGWDPIYTKMYNSIGQTYAAPNTAGRSAYQTYALNLNYKASENWSHTFTLGYNTLNSLSYDRTPNATTKLYSVTDSRTERWTASYNTSYQATLFDLLGTATTLGYDWTQYSHPFFSSKVADRNNYDFVDQNPGYVKNSGFYGQTQLSYNDFLFFTGGLRADKNPSGATDSYTWSPRLGLSGVYEIEKWMVKGRIAWGQSVIIPDASQVAGTVSSTYIILPNPNLQSQIQKGWEIGADIYYASILSVGLTYYNQKPTNLIETVNLGSNQGITTYQYQNVDEVKNEGFEIKAVTHPYDWLTVNINYGTNKSVITQLAPNYTGGSKVGDQLNGQPKYTLSTNIEVTPIEGTTVTLSAFQFGEWIAADFYGFLADVYGGKYNPAAKAYPSGYLITYPSYTKINMGISQKITDLLTGFIQVENLTNNDKFERLNMILTQPRTIIFGIRFGGITL